MAKKSIIEREKKRNKQVVKLGIKRAELKKIIANVDSSDEERWDAQLLLQKMPRDSSKTRLTNRCSLTGRSHGVYRKFGLSRNMLRIYAMKGEIPGLRKASW